jgi:hypothetical protein
MLCLEKEIIHKKNIQSQEDFEAEDLMFFPDNLNVDETKKLLSYVAALYRNGEINFKAFDTIARAALSIYIEKKIEGKLDEIIRVKFDGSLGRVIRGIH